MSMNLERLGTGIRSRTAENLFQACLLRCLTRIFYVLLISLGVDRDELGTGILTLL